jgi:CheY-like chemotaxis protein
VLVRHAIADYLRQCGYVVVEASTTDEAMIVLSDSDLNVEAVLCDAEAPGSTNAFQFRTWAVQHHQDVEVALAGSVDAAASKAAELCEEGPHLGRPYDPQSVLDYIRRLIGGRVLIGDVG